MSDRKTPSRSTSRNSVQDQRTQTARSGQTMADKPAAAAAGGQSSASSPKGGGGSSGGTAAGTASTTTSNRESLGRTPDVPVTAGVGQADDRDERIRRRAYELWEAEGWPDGREQEHWAQAQRELMSLGGAGVTNAATDQDRAGVVAPPSAIGQPGAAEQLDGTPSALRTAGGSRDAG